jgi:hypothetical protein
MKGIYYLTEITKHYDKATDIHWYAAIYSNGLWFIDREYSVGESIPTIILL